MKSYIFGIKQFTRLAFASACIGVSLSATGAGFTAGNIVACRYTSGAALTNGGTAIVLDEYTPGGTLIQTIALPTTTVGNQNRIVGIGTGPTEGIISLTTDGEYIMVGGYDQPVGTANATLLAAGTNRVVARVKVSDGTIDTTYRVIGGTTGAGTSAFRSLASTNGTDIWFASGNTSIRYTTYVTATIGTSTALWATAPLNTRVAHISGGQLYLASMTVPYHGISIVSPAMATSANSGATTATQIIGQNEPQTGGGTPQMEQFVFENASTLWVADNRTAANGGGLIKWTESAGVWTKAATFTGGGTVTLPTGCAIGNDGATPSAFFSTSPTNGGNSIMKIDRTSTPPGTFTNVVTTDANSTFKGLVYLPSTASVESWNDY